MDDSMITPTYTATATFDAVDRSWWQIRVTEDFGASTTTVARYETPVRQGYVDEAWTYLADQGWQLLGRERMIVPHGMERTVGPPTDATVESLCAEEYVFVRRCRARGISSLDALSAWRDGARDPDATVNRLAYETDLFHRAQAARGV